MSRNTRKQLNILISHMLTITEATDKLCVMCKTGRFYPNQTVYKSQHLLVTMVTDTNSVQG